MVIVGVSALRSDQMFQRFGGTYCLHLQGGWIGSSWCWSDAIEQNVSVTLNTLRKYSESELKTEAVHTSNMSEELITIITVITVQKCKRKPALDIFGCTNSMLTGTNLKILRLFRWFISSLLITTAKKKKNHHIVLPYSKLIVSYFISQTHTDVSHLLHFITFSTVSTPGSPDS